MAKITEYPLATKFDDGDVLIKDGKNGTKKITAEDSAKDLVGRVVKVTDVSGEGTKISVVNGNEEIELAKQKDLDKVNDDVSDLKESINEVYNGYNFQESAFEKGGLSSEGINQDYRSACRIRLTNITVFPFPITISVNTDHVAFGVHTYDANGNHLSNSDWQTEWTIPANTYFRFSVDGRYKQANETLSIQEVLGKIDAKSPNLSDIISDINSIQLSDIFVNVEDFGAKGDGTTDDTQAIQDALEAIKSVGGTVYIPAGTFLINTLLFDTDKSGTSAALHIYSNCRLLLDKNATLLCGDNVNHLIYTHNESDATGYTGCENIVIEGGTIDKGNVTATNCTPINISHGVNIAIIDMRFVRSKGTWHYMEINSSKEVIVQGCYFIGGGNTEDIQIDAASSGSGNLGTSDGTVCYNIDISDCYFNTSYHPAIGNHTEAQHHNIKIHDCIFYNSGSTRGAISFHTGTTKVDVFNNTFYENDYGLNMISEDASTLFRDNRCENVTTPFYNCTGHNNMIDGVYTV